MITNKIFNIFGKITGRPTLTLIVEPEDTILNIKEKISKKTSIPAKHLNLVCNCKYLQDSKKLMDLPFNVKDSTFHVHFKFSSFTL